MEPARARTFVVDDHSAFLRSVAAVVVASPGFELVGTASSGVEALAVLSTRSDVDLVLLDVNLPDLSGIEVARVYASSGGRALVILMSTSDPADLRVDAFDRGVAGFLPKETLSTSSLLRLWREVAGVS